MWTKQADGAYVQQETGAVVWYDRPSTADAGYVLRYGDEDIPLDATDADDAASALAEAEEIVRRRLGGDHRPILR